MYRVPFALPKSALSVRRTPQRTACTRDGWHASMIAKTIRASGRAGTTRTRATSRPRTGVGTPRPRRRLARSSRRAAPGRPASRRTAPPGRPTVAPLLQLGERLVEAHPPEVSPIPQVLRHARPDDGVAEQRPHVRPTGAILVLVHADADVLDHLDLSRVAADAGGALGDPLRGSRRSARGRTSSARRRRPPRRPAAACRARAPRG